MPKVYITREQEMNNALLRNIKGRLARCDKSSHAAAGELIRASQSTWGNRIKHPSEFKLGELRLLFDRAGFTDEEILEAFGRKMKGWMNET